MNDLLAHPVTERELEAFANQPGQALILSGPSGSGKLSLARWLAANILGLELPKLNDYPYQIVISSETASIGIEAVRQLEHFLSLKVPHSGAYNRVVIIDNAQDLSQEAQNALLKTLEEPPTGTFILMTVDNEQALLPTIRSRAPIVAVKKPARTQVEKFFGSDFDPALIAQTYAISGGLPGVMHAMLTDKEHPLLLATECARQLLSQSPYERLLQVDSVARQRGLAQDMVAILQQMAHVSLQSAVGVKAARWQTILQAAYQSGEALAANAQPKLVLTNLMLSF